MENNKHPEETNLRWFELKNTRAIMEKGHLEIRFSSGLFGIDIFEERGITSDLSGSDYVRTPFPGEED